MIYTSLIHIKPHAYCRYWSNPPRLHGTFVEVVLDRGLSSNCKFFEDQLGWTGLTVYAAAGFGGDRSLDRVASRRGISVVAITVVVVF